MDKMLTVYLSGPMEHVSIEEGTGWRNKVKDLLSDYKFVKVLDPYDFEDVKDEDGNYNVTQIVEGDKKAIMESDIVLINTEGRGCGTWMEQIFAWEQRKHIITFGNSKNPWTVYHSDVRCNNLIEAVYEIINMLS